MATITNTTRGALPRYTRPTGVYVVAGADTPRERVSRVVRLHAESELAAHMVGIHAEWCRIHIDGALGHHIDRREAWQTRLDAARRELRAIVLGANSDWDLRA
jgi:hypothetical protein